MSAPVTVAVVSWNTRELLRDCLRALEADRRAGLAEVWVVDNGSSDGSQEMVARDYPAVRLKRPAENLGFGRAVNLVAEASDSPWLVAANADTAVEPGAIGALVARCEADPGLGAAAPRLIEPGGGTQHSVHRFPTVTLSLAVTSGVGTLFPALGDRLCLEGRWNAERPRRVDWAHGAFLLMRREAFERVGGFDPEQWIYAEDIDLAWRLRGAGYRIAYEPGARVEHAGAAATSQAFGEDRRRRQIEASYAWMVRRRGIVVAWAFALVNAGGALARYLLTLVPATLGSRRAAANGRRWRSYVGLHRRGLRRRSRLLDAA